MCTIQVEGWSGCAGNSLSANNFFVARCSLVANPADKVSVGLPDRASAQPVPVIEIYVKEATGALKRALPSSLDGVQVNVVATGEIFAC